MNASSSARISWTSALVCASALGLLAMAICGWLTDATFHRQIWPSDIHAAVVEAFGGSVQTNALGQPLTMLTVLAVWIRLTGLTILLAVAASAQSRFAGHSATAASDINQAMIQTAVLSTFTAVWWVLWGLGELAIAPLAAFCVGCLPLWITVSGSLLVFLWWQTIFPVRNTASVPSLAESGQRQSLTPITLLGTAILIWTAISFWMNACLYQQLMIPHGDSAMYEEHLWNVWHGKGFRSYLDQGLFLGEHLQVIHLLLLPVHILWPSHLLLELAESVALASCAVPIYLIATRHTANAWAASLLGIAWLFYYPMHFLDIAIDQKTFRPIALGVPFLFWLIEYSERKHFGKAALCLVLALSAKEDMALITFPLLIVLAVTVPTTTGPSRATVRTSWLHSRIFGAVRSDATSPENPERAQTIVDDANRSRVWLLGLAGFSAVYLVVAVLVIIPAFRSGDHVHYSRYFGDLGGTPGELIHTALTKPLKVLARAISVRTVLYACVFLAPLAFFPLRKAWLLLAGALTFGMLSLLQFDSDGAGDLPPVPYHHFHAPLLPVLLWTTTVAVGLPWPFRRFSLGSLHRSTQSRALLVLLCCVGTSVTGSLMPFGVGFWSTTSPFGYSQLFNPTDPLQQRRAAMAEKVVQQIPVTARVASTDYIHTRLTHHARSYDYSNYRRAVNDYQPGVPDDTDYIVIDTGHRYSEIHQPSDVPELQQHPDQWEQLPDTTDGAFIVLKRRASARP